MHTFGGHSFVLASGANWLVATIMFFSYAIGELPAAERQPTIPTLSESEGDLKSRTQSLPKTVSQLDGWHGVQLEKSYEPPNRLYCSCVLPKRFGLQNMDEQMLLLRLIRDDLSLQADSSCKFIGCKTGALDQAFRLATQHQVADVAHWFVKPEGLAFLNLELSGELSERYIFDYRPKVLMKFRNLKNIVPGQEEAALAEEVCKARYSDAFLDGAGITPVIENLKRNGMDSLAGKILRECGTR